MTYEVTARSRLRARVAPTSYPAAVELVFWYYDPVRGLMVTLACVWLAVNLIRGLWPRK